MSWQVILQELHSIRVLILAVWKGKLDTVTFTSNLELGLRQLDLLIESIRCQNTIMLFKNYWILPQTIWLEKIQQLRRPNNFNVWPGRGWPEIREIINHFGNIQKTIIVVWIPYYFKKANDKRLMYKSWKKNSQFRPDLDLILTQCATNFDPKSPRKLYFPWKEKNYPT